MVICFSIDYSLLIYVVSISLQLAGALLLLLFVVSTKRSKVIRRFTSNGLIIRDGNTSELRYRADVFKCYFAEAYLGKFSFLYIATGYLLGVFSSNDSENYFLMLILILICTSLLIFPTLCIVKLIILYKKDINKKITNDELIELGIEPDMSSISNAEIETMFKERDDDIGK